MRKEKFVYNPQTLSFDRVEITLKEKIYRGLGIFAAVVVAGFIFTLIVWKVFPSPEVKLLEREIEQMQTEYTSLNGQLDIMKKVVDNLHERDQYAYRMIFGMNPIDSSVWNVGVGGAEKYSRFTRFKRTGQLLEEIQEKADKLKRRLAIQSTSLDTVLNLAKNKEEMLASIPSIKPVRSDKLRRKTRLLSGFGYRIHPIYKVRKLHTGIDFAAPIGTPIQATGNGVVVRVQRKKTGYGKNVIIDHGYGYKSLYGHMSKIEVKVGDKVKKGQEIGLVGNTGASTGPHCHYEVIHQGKKINPIHYVLDGLTPEEYQEMVDASSASNQSFD